MKPVQKTVSAHAKQTFAEGKSCAKELSCKESEHASDPSSRFASQSSSSTDGGNEMFVSKFYLKGRERKVPERNPKKITEKSGQSPDKLKHNLFLAKSAMKHTSNISFTKFPGLPSFPSQTTMQISGSKGTLAVKYRIPCQVNKNPSEELLQIACAETESREKESLETAER